jgi:hypothetical protein
VKRLKNKIADGPRFARGGGPSGSSQNHPPEHRPRTAQQIATTGLVTAYLAGQSYSCDVQIILEIRIPRDLLAPARWPKVEARLREHGFSTDRGFHPTPLQRMELSEELLSNEIALGLRGSAPERLIERLDQLDWTLNIRSGPDLQPMHPRRRWAMWSKHPRPAH